MKRPAPKESDIQRAILAVFAMRKDVVAWRQNTGGMTKEYKGRRHFVRFGVPGAADITGVILPWGTRLEVEVKRPGGRLSAAQRAFGDLMTQSGSVYFVAHSAEEALEKLDAEIGRLGKKPGDML
ncbi:MAG: hypothetical protein GTO22_14470 [Gemmatimonadales bacterium]|nr:hypothetical protein [Gemmatimonadales bacterium]